eukprot:CAMPEP_0119045298 /NCGR_PEP_ID=MMETSP1177-20130426/38770_1 /TAXON_ID=2985 /ORGANISM="Ochromonas sp, Strain CCMP1899" /LENGTH=145 /DNA_ID=CAMNT_0007016827 /DNA_START=115 /DNA_END=552 /DNA_ORIENTATION=-
MVDTLLLRSDDDGAGPFNGKASKPWYTVGLVSFEGGGIVEVSSLELELGQDSGFDWNGITVTDGISFLFLETFSVTVAVAALKSPNFLTGNSLNTKTAGEDGPAITGERERAVEKRFTFSVDFLEALIPFSSTFSSDGLLRLAAG